MTRLLRVAQIIDSLETGGAQALLVEFARRAPALGIVAEVLSLGPAREPYASALRAAGAEATAFPARKILSPVRLAALALRLRRMNCDLVHTHLVGANTAGALAARLAGIPVVAGLHEPAPVAPPGPRARLRRAIEAAVLRRTARAAVACGAALAADERTRLAGVPLLTLPNPAPDPVAPGAQALAAARAAFGPGEGPLFLAVGRLAPAKGFDTLLAAARRLRERGVPFRLAVAGGGALAGRLEALAAAAAPDGRVRLLGTRDDVGALMAAADVYVSSALAEGRSMALLEAMAHGLPIVATDVGDAREMLGGVGLLVPPADPDALAGAMAALAAEPARRAALAAAARARARDFGPAAWAGRLADLYRAAAAPPAAGDAPEGNRGTARIAFPC